MNKLHYLLVTAGAAFALGLSAGNTSAQERPERGNFDPEQARARMAERMREVLEITSDDEWKVIEPRVAKVMESRREMGGPGGPGGFFGRGGRRPGGDQGGGGGGGDGDRGGRRGFRPEPSAEAEALQKAIEAKAPADEIKAKLAKYRDSQKVKEANLAKAQDELRKVLSVRQEASAVLMGLLP